MGRRKASKPVEYLFVETDGQVYLVRDRGVWRFPKASERVPFPYGEGRRMDFGSELVLRARPKLAYHPEEWFPRDELFSRADVDGLVKKAVYMTMGRLVAEVVFVRDGKVLMEKAVRGFSKGYWNLPGGFLEFGESPEEGARREAEEELGVPVRVDGLLNTYMSGFPGKPTFTYGFVYLGTLVRDDFHPKPDEIDVADWFPIWRALELTRNPFAKWALVDVYRRGLVPPLEVRTHVPPEKVRATGGPLIFLDRDDVINRGRPGYVRTPSHFAFLPGAKDAMKVLRSLGYRMAVVSNQDAIGWSLITEADLRTIHGKMVRELGASGVRVENVYYCPHHLFDDCVCRKPRPGLLLAACKDLGVSPRDAWMVGDKVGDVSAGKAIGARTAFVGDAERRDKFADELQAVKPDLLVDSLAGFANALRTGPTST